VNLHTCGAIKPQYIIITKKKNRKKPLLIKLSFCTLEVNTPLTIKCTQTLWIQRDMPQSHSAPKIRNQLSFISQSNQRRALFNLIKTK
jgi:hypothetical protein